MRPARAVPLVLLFLLALAPSASAQAPFGRLVCVPKEAVRFCEGTAATRVASFDGVPLDVNVVLPKTGDVDLPLVVVLPAWSTPKKGFSDLKRWGVRGFAALSYTPRGFRESCGTAESQLTDPRGCERGWVHMADARREVRDTQHLAGLLVDQGLVHPTRIGATGSSYGGGQSLMLATLLDRTVLPDGSIVPWRSPGGVPMRLAAAAAHVPWSDFAYALAPDGSYLDYMVAPAGPRPVGVFKQTLTKNLFELGDEFGFYSPSGADPTADVAGWADSLAAGEPYAGTVAERGMHELTAFHSPIGLPMDRAPAPTFIVGGWTDDILPMHETLRFYNAVRQKFPASPISILGADWGHPRAQGKLADFLTIRERTSDWLMYHVKGSGVQPFTGFEAFTTTCPSSAASEGPLRAANWVAMHPGEVRHARTAGATVPWTGGDQATATAVDPYQGGGACVEVPAADDPSAATVRLPAVTGAGYLLMGSPTVIADIDIDGTHPQIAARLWDVGPDGTTQRLVSRGLVRPAGDGSLVFQLNAAAWRFAAGHVPKLELLGADAPYARRSNGRFGIRFGDVELRLPVAEQPATPGDQVDAPAPVVVQGPGTLAPDVG